MKICNVEGCDIEHTAKGFCDRHYRRFKKYGDPLAIDRRYLKPERKCSIKSCEGKHFGHGYCIKHYTRFKNNGDPLKVKFQKHCNVDGCKEPHQSKGYCSKHYYRLIHNGSPFKVKREKGKYKICTVEGCEEKFFSKKYCRKHYEQLHIRGTCTIEGCNKKLYTKKYCQMHYAREKKYGSPYKVMKVINSICEINGCENKAVSNGYCGPHYQKSDLGLSRYRAASAKRRYIKANAPFNDLTKEHWDECLNHFNNRCAYCGKEYKKLQIEHVVPLVSNGSHTKTNVVPSCQKCNRLKHAKPLEGWYCNQLFYSREREIKIYKWLGYKVKNGNVQIALF